MNTTLETLARLFGYRRRPASTAGTTPPPARPVDVRVGDVIAADADDIPTNVLGFTDSDGTNWVRAAGEDRYARDDINGELDRSQTYEWCTYGAHSTTESVLHYGPLTVTKVRAHDATP